MAAHDSPLTDSILAWGSLGHPNAYCIRLIKRSPTIDPLEHHRLNRCHHVGLTVPSICRGVGNQAAAPGVAWFPFKLDRNCAADPEISGQMLLPRCFLSTFTH